MLLPSHYRRTPSRTVTLRSPITVPLPVQSYIQNNIIYIQEFFTCRANCLRRSVTLSVLIVKLDDKSVKFIVLDDILFF